jgi:hypothetical protein
VIARVPLVVAVLLGLLVLGLSTASVLTGVPDTLESGAMGTLVLTGEGATGEDFELDPGMVATVVLMLSLAGLGAFVILQLLLPSALRRRPGARRVRSAGFELGDDP